ncbi:MAG: aldo/keto reductase [Armatimonadia bacterium]|nr:aldo/keto reductase [Armatimonadia bacterium]
MDTVELGKTGLRPSVMGLGAGGPSRLGQSYEAPREQSVEVVREALELGVTLIDTAEAYRTEEIVREGIQGTPRETLVLCTKKSTWKEPEPAEVRQGCEDSLRQLGVEAIDVYQMHGVSPERYPYVRDELVPVMLELRDEGKIRFLGITEAFESDTGHEMLQMALEDDVWDVMMVGFNLLNQTARERVFAETMHRGIGTLIMFAVRRAFSNPDRMREILNELVEKGQLDPEFAEAEDRFQFLLDGGAEDLADAAYRFCRYEPGADVVLSGTGKVEHLRRNVESLNRPPLSEAAVARAREIFAKVDSVSGS